MNFKRFNRIELLLPEDRINDAVDTFSKLLKISIGSPELLEGGAVWSTAAWEAGIEFIAPHGRKSPIFSLLERQNSWGAIGPIVWEVEDLEPLRVLAHFQGINIIYEYAIDNGGRQVYLDSDACFGYTLSFIEKPPGPSEPSPDSGALFTRINRVELLQPPEHLEQARVFFQELLGIEIEPLEYLPEHHVLTTIHRDAGIEIFGPGDDESVLHALLEAKGDLGAIGPIVWEVEDIDVFKRHAQSLGHKLIYEFEMPDRKQLCLDGETVFGYTATFTQFL